MPQLDISTFPSQIFWLFVSFTLLYLVLSRRILPLIGQVMQKRELKLAGDLKRAGELQAEAEQMRHEYELALQASNKKANILLQQVSEKIQKMQEERHRKLEESLEQQMAEAERRLQHTRERALKEMEQVALETTRAILVKFLDLSVGDDAIAKQLKQG